MKFRLVKSMMIKMSDSVSIFHLNNKNHISVGETLKKRENEQILLSGVVK